MGKWEHITDIGLGIAFRTMSARNMRSTGLAFLCGADGVTVPGVAHEGRYGNRSARRLTSLWDSWASAGGHRNDARSARAESATLVCYLHRHM